MTEDDAGDGNDEQCRNRADGGSGNVLQTAQSNNDEYHFEAFEKDPAK